MSFLPEDDVEFLCAKQIPHELKVEKLPDGTERRGIVFPGFGFRGNLRAMNGTQLVPCTSCEMMIIIPAGYATTRLDNFYTRPFLKRPDGTAPQNAAGEPDLFSTKWQFWSRHLADGDWRVGIDGLETFLQYVRCELARA